MKTLKLKDGITWIGSLDPDLRIFDIVMHTEFGTTYNSYVVQGTEKTAVFETVKVKCFDEYMEKLRSVVDPASIDYIVVDHTEPDHAGSVELLLDYAPNAVVLGSAAAINFLKAIANRDFRYEVVNFDTEIDLGGKTLKFISAPFLHWPDSIYTYIKEDKTIITCDSFGSHYSFDDILYSKMTDGNKKDYNKALLYYYTMIMGPFKPHVLAAIDKIEDLDIDLICPGHGPVLDENPRQIVETYRNWSTESNPNTKKTVIIPYVAAYGYTKELADKITEGIRSAGDIDVKLYDMVYADKSEVMEEIKWADGYLFGTPTINGDALPPIMDLVMGMSPIVHGRRLAAAFGSYGWSGEGVPNVDARLKALRMKMYAPGLRVNFKPSESELEAAFEYGLGFGEKLLGREPSIHFSLDVNDGEKHINPSGEMKLWKCVVCNEVFEGVEPPDICPACGASHEQFEEYVVVENTFASQEEYDVVIIGASAAGVAAAEAVRMRNQNASIELISAENHLGYYRPMLSDYLNGSHQESMFYLHDKSWYEENKIVTTLGVRVEMIDTENKLLELSNGASRKYEKLILANGSQNMIPKINEIEKTGVFNLKTIEDADAIKAYAKNAKKCVVIGAGLLGLEAAWELKELGLEIVVLERENRALPRQLDKDASSLFESGIDHAGIDFYKDTMVSAITGKEHVEGVQLCDGEFIACDMVIYSTGVKPSIDLFDNTGIITNRGVIVNDQMMTNARDVFACGDVCEHEGIVYGIWPTAIEQGTVAGANAVGDTIAFKPSIPANVFNGMHMKVFSIGDIGRDENHSYKEVGDIQEKQGVYKKMFFRNNHFVGGILIGDVAKSLTMIRGVGKQADIKEMVEEIVLK
ncbi:MULTISPECIES: FAD-dependent oxidoreductase [unclassified Fusibacter]|uniref:FAD-dependent oxidoreductase n=1 Tax=unclassified Fusibacter TaxID=2624464 RepID=UPI00101132D2|nr:MULTISPECIES: FAD-dependent oxidoreductase [unclassified Fusibacter]MCK8059251.1 FAD-dependent oxidoreductase [Fusibacter sp. A2]NPE21285.1 FAD-dependent oxidoreductase [Fusibacter sp. A1]RXV62550.1 MBL fold metallo-hydrolase [Fusibacter sp. A1]